MKTSCAAKRDLLDADLASAVTGASIPTAEKVPPVVAAAPFLGAPAARRRD